MDLSRKPLAPLRKGAQSPNFVTKTNDPTWTLCQAPSLAITPLTVLSSFPPCLFIDLPVCPRFRERGISMPSNSIMRAIMNKIIYKRNFM
jgi:hypothetical protein